jgi:hypothetical protein
MLRKLLQLPVMSAVLSVSAVVIAVSSTSAYAAAANFLLNVGNTSSAQTTLNGSAVAGKALQVTNQNTTAGAGALGLTVAAGHPPLTVNATAGKATNLNADKLDGLNSTQLQMATSASCGSQGGAVSSIAQTGQTTCTALPNLNVLSQGQITGPFPNANPPSFVTSKQTTALIMFSASAYRSSSAGPLELLLLVCHDPACSNVSDFVDAEGFTNESSSHKPLTTAFGEVVLPAGTWYLQVQPASIADQRTDTNDSANWTVVDVS